MVGVKRRTIRRYDPIENADGCVDPTIHSSPAPQTSVEVLNYEDQHLEGGVNTAGPYPPKI